MGGRRWSASACLCPLELRSACRRGSALQLARVSMRRRRGVRRRSAGGRLMAASDPIEAFLHEFERQLRVRRRARRRILDEVRGHLLDAAEVEQSGATTRRLAAERAVARFGLADATATQFNRLAARRTVVVRRAVAPWVAAVALTSLATATVWAFQPTPSRPHIGQGAQHVPGSRCSRHPGSPTAAQTRRALPRASTVRAPWPSVACRARGARRR
jgi:hypothetical protein